MRIGLWLAINFQISSNSTGALYVGRILLGLSNGLFIPYCILYMAIISHAHLRGSIGGMVQWQISFGALLGILVDNYANAYSGKKSFQIPLAVMYVVPVIISIFLLFLPETPRYSISKGQYDKAGTSIRRTWGIFDTARIETGVQDIKKNWVEEPEMLNGTSVMDMFKGADLRLTLIALCIIICQTATGESDEPAIEEHEMVVS
jgi:MFS transporter, SP family, sugar:H+ symporter